MTSLLELNQACLGQRLQPISVTLRADQRVVLLGASGAGKTTFLDVITGKVAPTQGDVLFKGRSLLGRSEHRIARLGVG